MAITTDQVWDSVLDKFKVIRSLSVGDRIRYGKYTSTEVLVGTVKELFTGEYVIVTLDGDASEKGWWESESQFAFIEKI